MKQCRPNYRALVLVIVFACQAALPLKTFSQSRSNRCTPRGLTPPVLLRETSMSFTLLPPTILVCRLEREINSKTAKAGDPIEARVVEPINDQRGAVIVPRDSKVLGRINRVFPASAKRPAMIDVSFTALQRCRVETINGLARGDCNFGQPDTVKLTSVLAPLTKEDCKTLNQDGLLEGGHSSSKRSLVFVGGGAGSGGIVGGLVTGALLGAGVGAGIGAGVGAVASLLGKSKHVKIAANKKFGLELTSPLTLRSTKPTKSTAAKAGPKNGSTPPATNWGARLITVREARVKQEENGELRILATGIAPNNTWDIYLENKGVQNGVLYLNLMGYPTQNWAANQTAPVRKQIQLTWPDAYHQIRRVIVRGEKNSQSQAYIYPPGSGVPGDINQERPEQAIDPTGARISKQLDALVRDYEQDLNGRLRSLRGTSSSQAQLLNALKRAAESARVFRAPLTPAAKRTAASRLSIRAEAVSQAIAAVPGLSYDYRQRWQAIQSDIDDLENTAG